MPNESIPGNEDHVFDEPVVTTEGGQQQTQVRTEPVVKQNEGQQQTQVEPEVKPAPAPSGGMSKEDLKEVLSAVTQQQGAKEPPKQMTEAEIRKALNYYGVSEADLAEFHEGGPKAVASLQRMLDGQAKYALTLAQTAMAAEFKKLRDEYAPLVDYGRKMQVQEAKFGYFEKNPTHKGLEPLVQQVAQQLVTEKFNPKTQEEAFAEVCKRVDALATSLKIPRETIATIVQPNAGGKGAGTDGQQQQGTTKMSSVSAGGQGGAGPKGGAVSQDDVEAKIWG